MLKPIRVWFVRTDLRSIGGAERVLFQIISGLDQHRFEPVPVLLYEHGDFGTQIAEKGITVRSGLARSKMDFRLPFRLLKLAKEIPPDVLFTTENAISLFWCGVLRRLKRAKALVAGFHTTRFQTNSVRLALRFSAKYVDQFVALSATHQQFWQQATGAPASKFVIIPNGIDMQRFSPVEDKSSLRSAHGVPTDIPVAGLVAHLKAVKNLSLFVEVADSVLQTGTKAHFIVVGDGPESSSLKAEIEKRGLQTHFTLPGSQPDPAEWHRMFDVLLLTSHSEAMPLTILEANACGVPAVATDVGGVRDVIVQGETGYYVPAGDADALTQRLLELFHQPETRQRMGQAARHRAEQYYSLDAMVCRYAGLFERLSAGSLRQ